MSDKARLVVILGIDGSGKSTVAQRVCRRALSEGTEARTMWARWQPRLLRPLRSIVRLVALGRRSHVAGKEEPVALSSLKGSTFTRWRWLGIAYVGAALVDYWLQYRRPFREAMRDADLVILDRYWYDLVIDAVGNTTGGPKRAAGLVRGPWRRWFPSPDLVILLDVNEAVAQRRKGGENPVPYLRERRRLYAAVADRKSVV